MYVDEDEKAFTCPIKVRALFDVHRPPYRVSVSEFYTTELGVVREVQKCKFSIVSTGCPRHRENREFGSYFFQTGKTGNFALRQGKILRHRENIFL